MGEAYAHTLPSPIVLPGYQSLNTLRRISYNAPHEIRRAAYYRGGMTLTRLGVGVVVLSLFALVVAAPMGYALAGGGHVKEPIKHAEESLAHAEQASSKKGKGKSK